MNSSGPLDATRSPSENYYSTQGGSLIYYHQSPIRGKPSPAIDAMLVNANAVLLYLTFILLAILCEIQWLGRYPLGMVGSIRRIAVRGCKARSPPAPPSEYVWNLKGFMQQGSPGALMAARCVVGRLWHPRAKVTVTRICGSLDPHTRRQRGHAGVQLHPAASRRR